MEERGKGVAQFVSRVFNTLHGSDKRANYAARDVASSTGTARQGKSIQIAVTLRRKLPFTRQSMCLSVSQSCRSLAPLEIVG